jgi:hypothetical protein
LFKLFSDTNVVKFYNLKPFENESDGVRLVNLYTQRFNEKIGITMTKFSMELKKLLIVMKMVKLMQQNF